MGFKSINSLTKKAAASGMEKLPVSANEYLETKQISDISLVESRPELYDWSIIEKVFDLKDIFYEASNKCYSYRHPDGGIIQIGQQLDLNYTNVDTVELTEKMLVSLVPLSGNRKGIKRLDITSKESVENYVGMVTATSIPINQDGRVTIIGEVDANTAGQSENAIIYGSLTPGMYSLTPPAKGYYKVHVGSISVSANNGKILIKPYILPMLDDLSDVSNNASHGQPLTKQENGTWAGDDELQIEKITPPSGTFNVDGDFVADDVEGATMHTGTLDATGKITGDEVESTNGFKKTSYTDNDILTANGGTIALESLKAGIYQLLNPSDGTTVVVEVNSAGDVLISGNVIISGGVYEVEAQQISTSEQTVELRRDATTGMAIGDLAGFIIKLYDGVNDGMMVIDKDGIMRIGDVGDLQPVLTREESPVDYSPMYFNVTTNRAETLVGTTAKTSLVNNDAIMVKDSEDSYKPKWWTFSNIKANLKAYFDTLYIALSGNQVISGIKTFLTSPIVPDPVNDTDGVNKRYVDTVVVTQSNVEQVRSQATNKVPASKLLDDLISPLYNEVIETQDLTPENFYVRYDTGIEVSSSEYRIIEMAISHSDKLYLSGFTRSTAGAGICFYDSNGVFISSLLRGSGTDATFTDYVPAIPSNAALIKVGGTDLIPPVIKKVTSEELSVYKKTESDIRYNPKYGIRWNISSDSSMCERLFSAVGLTATPQVGTGGDSDFDNIYPWSDIKRCNVKKLLSGAIKVTYEGEAGYSTDGSNGDVFSEIPIFYYERYIKDGYEYRIISESGKAPHPAFIENGKILEKIYISSYETALVSGEAKSIAEVVPWMNETFQTFLDAAQSKGAGFTLGDYRTIDALTNLMWVEYGTRNSVNVIGHGWSHLHQATLSGIRSIASELAVNTITSDYVFSDNVKERFFVGSSIVICDTEQTNIVAVRNITNIEFDTPSAGQTTITFNGSPIDINTNMFVGHSPQPTGQTDTMTFHTGRTDRAKVISSSTLPRNTLNPNRYRGIENLVGNTWMVIPDVTFNNLIAYVSRDITDYEFAKKTGSYTPLSVDVPEQPVNNSGLFIAELSIDNLFNKIPFAKTFGDTNDGTKYFGAYHYLYNNTDVVGIHGGGFDHHIRTNMMTLRFWATTTTKWYLYGSRLQYKPI